VRIATAQAHGEHPVAALGPHAIIRAVGRLGSIAVVAGAAVVTALLFGAGLGILPLFPVVIAVALIGAMVRSLVPERTRTLVRSVLDRAFVGFFSVYLLGAVTFLFAGLAPALAHAIPSLHDSLHRYAGAVEGSVEIVARGNAFDLEVLRLPSGVATLQFTNLDVGVEHNVSIYSGVAAEREPVFQGRVIRGTSSTTYTFQSPPPGEYLLWCDVHTFMNGKVIVTSATAIGTSPGPGGLRALAGRVASASHGSAIASDTTGQRLVPGGQVAANYVFSAIDLVLAVFLVAMRPRDRTARLLALGLVGTGAVFNAQAHVAFEVLPGHAMAAFHDTFHVGSGVAFMLAMLLFPDGRFVPRIRGSSAMRWLARAVRVGLAFVFVVVGVGAVSTFHGTDPAGYVAFFGVIVPGAGVISQAVRVRQSRTEGERRRTRVLLWALAIPLAATVVALGLVAVVGAIRGTPLRWSSFNRTAFLLFPPLFTVIPLTLVVVLVRYRLWDVERVVSKAIVYGVLAAFISTVYVLIVAGLGAAIGTSGPESLPLSIAATAAVAVVFEPLRRRLQRVANVLVYGQRASPYEVVAGLARRIAESLSVEETLPALAEAAAQAVGAERAKAEVTLPSGAVRSAVWPSGADEGAFDLGVVAHHSGRPVGQIHVAMPPGAELAPGEDALLEVLARQAGPALHNVQLAAELQTRLEEISRQADQLRASQQRLVAAQDAAARRLERDLHDGAQQQLVAMMITARLARQVARTDPDAAERLLAELQAAGQDTLDNIRDLARGIYPPKLALDGLGAALEAHVRRSPVPVRIESNGLPRFGPEVEAAVYFCVLEAIQNVAKYAGATGATVRLDAADDRLAFSVTDDGRGFDPGSSLRGSGLQNMQDRLEALGGGLAVTSSPGQGTRVAGWLPARTSTTKEGEAP
jgi:signal transduction histidine kinase/plastocyanin